MNASLPAGVTDRDLTYFTHSQEKAKNFLNSENAGIEEEPSVSTPKAPHHTPLPKNTPQVNDLDLSAARSDRHLTSGWRKSWRGKRENSQDDPVRQISHHHLVLQPLPSGGSNLEISFKIITGTSHAGVRQAAEAVPV